MTTERPNTLSGLRAKLAGLMKYRDPLEDDIRAVTVDIDPLEANICIFDPEDTPTARRRYAAMHRARKGQSARFVPDRLRATPEPLTGRQLAEAWCEARGLQATDPTPSPIRKRIGATLKALHNQGRVRQEGYVGAHIGWRLA